MFTQINELATISKYLDGKFDDVTSFRLNVKCENATQWCFVCGAVMIEFVFRYDDEPSWVDIKAVAFPMASPSQRFHVFGDMTLFDSFYEMLTNKFPTARTGVLSND